MRSRAGSKNKVQQRLQNKVQQRKKKKKWQLLKKVRTLTDHLTIQELFTEHWEEPL